MITFYKDEKLGNLRRLAETPDICPDCWISMIAPTESEVQSVSDRLSVDKDFLMAALDEDERSRIDYDDEQGHTLIIVQLPYSLDMEDDSKRYETVPLGIIKTNDCLITVCANETRIISSLADGSVKNIKAKRRSEFIWTILKNVAMLYQKDLIQLDRHSSAIESKLQESLKNQELIQLLGIEKSLVYFSTALKSNELVMEKLLRTSYIEKFEEDNELLEEAIIENKQAIEMAKIYSDILAGTMDAFASIISNNLNIVMKYLAAITIIMSIPNIITSFFGMNVLLPMQELSYAYLVIIGISIIACIVAAVYMFKRKMF